MRQAKFEDLKRAISKRGNAAPVLRRLHFSGVPGFNDSTIEPRTSFLAICGGTGVGKSALLEIIYAGLGPYAADRELAKARLATAKLQLQIEQSNATYSADLDLALLNMDGVEFEPMCEIYRLEERAANPANTFFEQEIEVVLDGVDPNTFSGEQLEISSLICRKPYQKIEVYETEGRLDSVIPFFRVWVGGLAYDNRTMATGELSALYLSWAVFAAPQGAILLIEEPEAFLPPSSHKWVLALLLSASVKKNLGVFLSTHSAEIVSEIEDRNLLSITAENGVSSILKTEVSKRRVLSRLGLSPGMAGLVFVEDSLAAGVFEHMLQLYGIASAGEVIVEVSGGFGEIVARLRSLPTKLGPLRIIGCPDGDVQAEAEKSREAERLFCLPFPRPIEVELLEAVRAKRKAFAKSVGRKESEVSDLLEELQAENHHDSHTLLCRRLSISSGQFISAAFPIWLRENRRQARKFAFKIASALGLSVNE